MRTIYIIIRNNRFFKPLTRMVIILLFLVIVYQAFFFGHVKASAQRADCQVMIDGTTLANGTSQKVRPGSHTITSSGLKAQQSHEKVWVYPFITKTISCSSTVLDGTAIIKMTVGGLKPKQSILSQEFFKDDSWFVAYIADGGKAPSRIIGSYSVAGWSIVPEDTRASMPIQVQRYLENEDTNE